MKLVLAIGISTAFCAACVDVTPPWRVGSHLGGNRDDGAIAPALGGSHNTSVAMDTGSGDPTGGTTETGPVATGGMEMPAGGANAVGSGGAGGSTVSGTGPDAAGDDASDVSIATGGSASRAGAGGAITSSGGIVAATGGTASGGVGGKGGAVGGTIASGGVVQISCANPLVPTNGNPPSNGVVTDFSHWDPALRTWGRTDNVNGVLFKNAGNGATMADPTVEGSPPGMHLVATIPPSSNAGGGLQFMVCATVASFGQIRFTYYGGAPGCSLDLLIHTLSQSTMAGGCTLDGGNTCNDFPRLAGVVNVSSSVSQPTQVTKLLSDFKRSNGAAWSATDARQVVGIEWRFANGGTSTSCSAGLTITGVTLLP